MGAARPHRVGALSLAIALLAAALFAGDATAQSTRPCPGEGVRSARCLHVDVPLDRSGSLPGAIGLRVRILPPVSGTPSETILALAGGPGQAAAPLLLELRLALSDQVLRSRRLVAFDQRGTGRSEALRCPSLGSAVGGDDASPTGLDQAVGACATRLGPARAHYTTADSVEDIEAVRTALGVDRKSTRLNSSH